MEYMISMERIEEFRRILLDEEKSAATIDKYLRDVKAFARWLGEGTAVCKERVIAYKNHLLEHYCPASINSMLASVNCFFKHTGWMNCVVKSLKIQRESFRAKELTREEYMRLLKAAKKNRRLKLVMQTLCGTGIRVSELVFITKEAAECGQARVSMKGKTRTVLLPGDLCILLKKYAKEKGIEQGSIFITRNQKPLDRSNILHDMKALCEQAGVAREKVFPHNLRHLFACTFYKVEKDLPHLADVLGHSNINTTRIYTLVSGEEQAKQIDGLGLVVLDDGEEDRAA